MSAPATEVAGMPRPDKYFCEIPNEPCAIVMFGASGDLAKRKLLPALYDLAVHSCLGPRFRLVGFARTEMGDDEFRGKTEEGLPKPSDGSGAVDKREGFLSQLHYFTGNYDDPESYRRLARASGRTRPRRISSRGIGFSIWPRLPMYIRTSSSNWAAQAWRNRRTANRGRG